MDRNTEERVMNSRAEIRELTSSDLDQVSGGSLLGTMLRPTMAYLERRRLKNAIKVIEQAGQQIRDAIK